MIAERELTVATAVASSRPERSVARMLLGAALAPIALSLAGLISRVMSGGRSSWQIVALLSSAALGALCARPRTRSLAIGFATGAALMTAYVLAIAASINGALHI